MRTTVARIAGIALAALLLPGCNPTVKVEPIKVEPIHVTLDINIRIDKELDKFFDFEEKSPASKPQSNAPGVAPGVAPELAFASHALARKEN